ncbi:MAG: sulfite exporter TauE/SafE family protein [Desulfobulbales bacterium]|nr:sulfite exporter TauE/SafE family protein [Desulfobulbales bacterium]
MTDLAIPLFLLAAIFLLVAFFYASVGLGGGSSYTALLALAGASTAAIPLVSLTLNLVVTTIGSSIFLSRGHGRLRLIAPFLVSSIPMAYLGGGLHLPPTLFYLVLMLSLAFAALRIYFPGNTRPLALSDNGKILLALFCGALLGLVAGIAGIGGGVYLVPLIILLGLGTAKEAAACGSFFIWVNSVAGLLPRLQHPDLDLATLAPLAAAVLLGGMAGSLFGADRFEPRTMQKILGGILLVAILFLGRKIAVAMM